MIDDRKSENVEMSAVPFKGLPQGHSGEGEPPFLFVDEIRVN